MIWIETGGPAIEPVGTAELRLFLRLERGDEDALLLRLLRAAREDVERRTGLLLAERTGRLVLPVAIEPVTLGFRPVSAVTALALLGEDGSASEGDPALVRVENGAARTGLHWRRPLVATGGVELELSAGLAPALVPEALRLAILRMAATTYETRTLLAPAAPAGGLSPLVGSLLRPFRPVGV